jgi:hypothetical protein
VLRLSLKLSADSEVILKTWDYRDSFLNRPPVYNKKRKDRFFRVSFGADMRKAVLSAFHEVSRDKVNSFKIKKPSDYHSRKSEGALFFITFLQYLQFISNRVHTRSVRLALYSAKKGLPPFLKGSPKQTSTGCFAFAGC